jgi:RNA polymerase sigma factor (sigma-70 family)
MRIPPSARSIWYGGAAGGDKQLVADATQDAYLVMLDRWHERCRSTHDDNRRYVVGIAMHKLADAYRQRGRFGELDSATESSTADSAINRLLDEMSVLQAVRDLLVAQPPRRRLVGVLYFLEECSYEEIASLLTMAPSTVRTHVDRLRRLLRPYVARIKELDRGGEPS